VGVSKSVIGAFGATNLHRLDENYLG